MNYGVCCGILEALVSVMAVYQDLRGRQKVPANGVNRKRKRE